MARCLSFHGCRQVVACVGLWALLASQVGAAASAGEDQVEQGRELFRHEWVPHDELSPAGDGLGPMHNADSCVACHSLGGVGGAGPTERNVTLLTALPVAGATRGNASRIHPSLTSGGSVLLHDLGGDREYERWRLRTLGFKLPAETSVRNVATRHAIESSLSSLPPGAEVRQSQGFSLRLSRRNTPALFGAGQLDRISENTLRELAKRQQSGHPGIEGRVPRTADGKVGRFGWRGQVATLEDFVLTACAMELGLQNAGHPQAVDPRGPREKLKGDDLTPDQCDALVAFVAALPAPEQLEPADETQADRMQQGEKAFETIGCTACHVPDVGRVRGIFSDLLLHDMGPALEDPAPAFPEHTRLGRVRASGGYGSGKTMEVFTDTPSLARRRREWRTPPLWGVRDSAPYLHDGRAATLEQAIAAHGGEAETSAKQFADLNGLTRSHILIFLSSLGARR